MALTYTLREGMTNGDLPDEGENHFAFLTHMMAVGVPHLTSRERLNKFKDRATRYSLVGPKPGVGTIEDHISWLLEYSEACEGMTTNISVISDEAFNKKLLQMLHQRATLLRKRLES